MEHRIRDDWKRLDHPYTLMLAVYLLFIGVALLADRPADIAQGFVRILQSRGVLLTDYMAVGGIGAALVNSALVGTFGILMLIRTKITPHGATIMALWLSTGFSLFGKNIFNMLPLTLGVWLYARVQKKPFGNFSLVALLAATLSPVVSGICFHPDLPRHISIPLGIFAGIVSGFIFPAVSAFTVRVHGGYCLYNMGFAGGLISTFIVAVMESFQVSMTSTLEWRQGESPYLVAMLYLLSAGLMLLGLFEQGKFHPPQYRRLMRRHGRMVSDFYLLHGREIYFNMGLLCALATTVILLVHADINGATLCGIFTIVGFGAFGKHLRNVLPLLVGAIIATQVNWWDPTNPMNTLAILFSTGLAPIAGQFGWIWGMAAGFLHVNAVMQFSFLNSGLNLYNNGYAGGFVAMLLIPIITAFATRKRRESEQE